MNKVRASASLPLISNTVEVDGMKLLDGGVSDSIPIFAFRRMGYRRNIVILTRPKGYRKRSGQDAQAGSREIQGISGICQKVPYEAFVL